MAMRCNPDDVAIANMLLAEYDALRNWTMTESRWIATRLGWSDAKAWRVVHVARRYGRYSCELCGEPAGKGNALCPACAESR